MFQSVATSGVSLLLDHLLQAFAFVASTMCIQGKLNIVINSP